MLSLDIINIIIVKTGNLSIAIQTNGELVYKIYRRSTHTFKWSIENDYLDAYKWLLENFETTLIRTVTKYCLAATHGNLRFVKWLGKHKIPKDDWKWNCLMFEASNEGHLKIVKWIYYTNFKKCKYDIMDRAAVSGNFKLVKWIHYKAHGICSTNGIRWARECGHQKISNW